MTRRFLFFFEFYYNPKSTNNLLFYKIFKDANEVPYKLLKEEVLGPTEIRTRIAGFRVPSDNHYTIRPARRTISPRVSTARGPLSI